MRSSDVKSFFPSDSRFQVRANRNFVDVAWHNPVLQTEDREITTDLRQDNDPRRRFNPRAAL